MIKNLVAHCNTRVLIAIAEMQKEDMTENSILSKVVSDSQLIQTEPIPDLGAGNRISQNWGIGLVELLHETFQMIQI